MEEVDQLSDILEKGGISRLEATDSGQITASLIEAPNQISYSGIPDIFSVPVAESSPEGLQPVDAPNLAQGNQLLRTLIFKDKQGKKRKQMIYPYFASTNFGINFTVDIQGKASFTFNNVSYSGALDYGIKRNARSSNSPFNVESNGDGSFMLFYPSGEMQVLYPAK